MMTEKELSYQTTNTYSTLNNLTANTKNIWVVFHGIGYLSRYFLKYFKDLNPEENYIIAPQAASKYYLNNEYRHVGASWLTKENTQTEMENVLNYLDGIFQNEKLGAARNLIVCGYSQGVSIAARWVSRRKINCSKLIFMSGKIPSKLNAADFQFLKNTRTYIVYGTEDKFFNAEIFQNEKLRAKELFGSNLEIIPFEGGHEVNKEIIQQVLNH